ncbi:Ger(x)C family spore germination protein [Paenibacillus psychroresistens]|uniref:Ger(X)C family spore germination protein n=1 Tax=Paenibacillus psychroresistens TaxID=1778678 RepID=A0A6B8RQ00_9BACL|nr:Ger(x)C family spore germination protein [Paenibacillus psychroresistens]QGQ97884.1 Ger(x)C family spore germination protein [Paenibacillus psychroresistens]
MGKRIAVGVIIIMLSITSGGCWDIRYLDELAIVFAIGLDTSDSANLKVTVQVVNPTTVSLGSSKSGGGGNSAVTTYSETGPTFLEAIRKMTSKTSRALYFSHNQVLVIGEDLAKEGVRQLFDFIERDPAIRTDFYIVIAKGAKAADVLKITTPVEMIPGTKIHDSIDNVEKKIGTSYKVSMKDIIQQINSGKQEIVAGSVEIVGDKKQGGSKQNIEEINPTTLLKLNGMAVFKHEKLEGFMTPGESKGLSWINNRIKNTVIHIPCEKEGTIAIEIMHSSTKLKVKLQDNQPSFSIHVRQEANIGEIICSDLDISDKKTFEILQKQFNEKIKKQIMNTVTKVQEMETDIFGFADLVNKKNPAYWKKNQHQWDGIFAKVPVTVEVETNIRREGIRGKSYYQKNS